MRLQCKVWGLAVDAQKQMPTCMAMPRARGGSGGKCRHDHQTALLLTLNLPLRSLSARLQELSNLLWSMAAMDFYPGPAVMDALSRVS